MKHSPPIDITICSNLRLTHVPSDFRAELTEKLKFPNPKYVENARMGRWNRGVPKELRFFDKVGGNGLWIPRGYIRQLINLCRIKGIAYHIHDQRRSLPDVNFIFNGNMRPFQQKAVDIVMAKEFGTLSAPTGSGKTVMALMMIAKRRQPTLIIVHTKDLAFQWIERIETFLKIPSDQVGLIGSGQRRIGKKITVALVQSLYRCAEEVAPSIGHLVVDECHRAPSRTFTEAVTEFDSRYMLGLSATPWRRDKLSKLIFWHLGDVHYKMEKADLVESGDVLPAEIIARETDFKPYYDPVNEYTKMLSELTINDERNHMIASDVAGAAETSTGVCLVLSDRKKHCETLTSILRYKHKLSCELLTGNLKTHERQAVMNRLNEGKVKVLVATGQLVGEGFDCSDLTELFLTTPIKFSGRVIQYLGRILRPAPGKKRGRVYDYVDVHVDVLKAAAKSRQRVYRDMEWKDRIME